MDGTTTEINWNQCTPVTSEQNNRFKADFVAYDNLSMYRSEEKFYCKRLVNCTCFPIKIKKHLLLNVTDKRTDRQKIRLVLASLVYET